MVQVLLIFELTACKQWRAALHACLYFLLLCPYMCVGTIPGIKCTHGPGWWGNKRRGAPQFLLTPISIRLVRGGGSTFLPLTSISPPLLAANMHDCQRLDLSRLLVKQPLANQPPVKQPHAKHSRSKVSGVEPAASV